MVCDGRQPVAGIPTFGRQRRFSRLARLNVFIREHRKTAGRLHMQHLPQPALLLHSCDDHIEGLQSGGAQPAHGFILRSAPQRVSLLQDLRTFGRKTHLLT
jgi:hypothetical protein